MVHTDVWGPAPGASYFVTFVDDYSRKVWIYLMRHKFQGNVQGLEGDGGATNGQERR